MPDPGLAERIERIEAHLAIQQLAIRYAMAVDARDMEAWVRCFRPDVDMGRHGTGREALRRYIDPMVRRFYRSVHQICGHRIELTTQDTATGAVYCRAEHEAGDEWIVMAICYFDEYARVDGRHPGGSLAGSRGHHEPASDLRPCRIRSQISVPVS